MRGFLRGILVSTCFIALMWLASCGSGSDDPAQPGIESPATPRISDTSSQRSLLGYYNVSIDLINEVIESVPLRDTAFHLNVLPFLEPPPLENLTLAWETLVVDLDNNSVEVDVVLTHPFMSSPEFIGFDVKGIIITDGSLSGFEDSGITIPKGSEPYLANADGSTRWWNPTEFMSGGIFGYNNGLLGAPDSYANYKSTVNGYKYFADGFNPNASMGSLFTPLRGKFSPGSSNRRHFVINFGSNPGDFLVFNYAIDASWHQPDVIPPGGLDDFPPSANQTEAFAIIVTESNNSLYYANSTGSSGGSIDLKIDVYDWQGVWTVGSVRVEAPEVFSEVVYCTPDPLNDPGAMQGTYYVTLSGSPQPSNGRCNFLISVEDIYENFSQGGMNMFLGPDNLFLTSYYVHSALVADNNPPNVGPIVGDTSPVAGTSSPYFASVIDFEDNIGSLTFEWEIGDDVPPLYDDGPGNSDGTMDITFPDNGTYIVDLRVTDTQEGSSTSSQPLTVNVSILGAPPNVGNVALKVVRDAFSLIDHVDLTWDFVPGAAQYAIYYTDDPYTPGEFQELGTTAFNDTSFTYLNIVKDNAYLFTIRTRSVPGNPNSESGDSEYAFVEFETAEDADPYPWVVGSRVGGYYTDHWDRATGAGASPGQKGWRMDITDTFIRAYSWSVIASPEVPNLADTEMYRIEFLRRHPAPFNFHGLSIGTTPVIYDSPNSTFPSFDTTMDYIEGMDYTGSSNGGIMQRFGEVSGSSGAYWNFQDGWALTAFELPRLGTLLGSGLEARAAIAYGADTHHRTSRVEMDEIALIIY